MLSCGGSNKSYLMQTKYTYTYIYIYIKDVFVSTLTWPQLYY